MIDHASKAQTFHSLHVKGHPVVLYNIWDPGSAKAVAAAGAQALATGSAPVAMAFGYADGEQIPIDTAIDNIRRIVASTDLPVTVDLEGGYGVPPETVATSIARAMEVGAIGFNFEDQVIGGSGLHDLAVQVPRLEAACRIAEEVGAFVNARTDIFLKAPRDRHDRAMLDQAVERAKAYEQAGAHGFFAPGLADEALIGALCAAVALPVNIIALPGVPPRPRLAELGVARISYGSVPWKQMMACLETQAREAIAD